MSRLRKTAGTETMYHATTLENLRSIVSSGAIIPQAGQGVGMQVAYEIPKGVDVTMDDVQNMLGQEPTNMNDFAGFIFLTEDYHTASDYALRLWENRSSSQANPGVVLEISIDDSKLLPDDIDSPESKTWQESMRAIHQVKTGEQIPVGDIKIVHFIDEFGGSLEDCTLDKFEDIYKELAEDFRFVVDPADMEQGNYWIDEDDEDSEPYDYEAQKEMREKKEQTYKDLKKELSGVKVDQQQGGYTRIFDCSIDKAVKAMDKANYELAPDFWMAEEESEVEGHEYLEVVVDKEKNVFITDSLYESTYPSPIIFKSTDRGETFLVDLTPSLQPETALTKEVQEKLKMVLKGKTINTEDSQSMSIEQFLGQYKQASINNRLRKLSIRG